MTRLATPLQAEPLGMSNINDLFPYIYRGVINHEAPIYMEVIEFLYAIESKTTQYLQHK
jgi:hypothetical protein